MLKPARYHACVDRKAPPYHLARPSIPRRMANPSTLPSHPPSRMVVLSTMFGTTSYGLRNECRVVEQDNQRKCSGNQREAFWELTGFGFVGTPKLSELEAGAIPGWVTTLGSCSVSSQEQIRAGPVVGAKADNIVLRRSRRGLLGAHWLRVRRNSEVKRVGGWSNPRMGDHPGKLFVSSQKQNRAGW
ncbi:hypothetical protein L3X38_026071 [Prunus dulcis]|uniref:Uncharacterized protein n=1 Tax=Prunus dulcis TaxID=3755 RepID=A0AAD4W4R0_PRUDU|nr:hypothetical protein L3X38_026071 [Prunus dulcis]